jgi:hypothetical protein
MKREEVNVVPVNVVPLEGKATACTTSGGQQAIPAISALLIAIAVWW